MSIYNPDPLRCSWCDAPFHRQGALTAHEAEHRTAEIEADAEKGRRAREDGLPLTANPFPPNTHPWQRWRDGWHDVDTGLQIERAA